MPENTPNNSLSPADRVKPWRWKKGAPSPNPGGRPKKRPITDAYERWANRRLPERLRRTLDRAGAELPKNATYADAGALGLLRASIKGNAVALREVREAIEGKVVDRVEVGGPDGGPIQFDAEREREIVACLITLGVSQEQARAIASGEGLLPQFKGGEDGEGR